MWRILGVSCPNGSARATRPFDRRTCLHARRTPPQAHRACGGSPDPPAEQSRQTEGWASDSLVFVTLLRRLTVFASAMLFAVPSADAATSACAHASAGGDGAMIEVTRTPPPLTSDTGDAMTRHDCDPPAPQPAEDCGHRDPATCATMTSCVTSSAAVARVSPLLSGSRPATASHVVLDQGPLSDVRSPEPPPPRA